MAVVGIGRGSASPGRRTGGRGSCECGTALSRDERGMCG